MSHRIAVVQMVSSANVEHNLKVAENYIVEAAEKGAKMVALPENFACMSFHERDKLALAETGGDGPIQQWLSYTAKENHIFLLGGTVPIKVPGKDKIYAASLLFDDQGEQVARYDKIHLFDVTVKDGESYQESAAIEPGSNIVAVDTPVGRVGLTVCYDLRFAEIFRQLIIQEVDLFFVPSAFTETTGSAHWEVLLRARAIENLAYVAAPNQGGKHENGRMTYGHSMIIDPWGKVLVNANRQSGPIYADIDLEDVKRLRAQFPCNQHHVLK